jgi:hypothetical protein
MLVKDAADDCSKTSRIPDGLKGTCIDSLVKSIEGGRSNSRRSEEERMRVSLLMG